MIYLVLVVFLGTPVFFRQTRAGQNGEQFQLIKFRTMTVGNGPDSERITRLGKILRATSLDELPSVWNVFKGELSFVGPRPLLPEYTSLYNIEQKRRLDVKPGITGLAQISGRNSLSWDEKFVLDIEYVNNQSFILDLKILIQTAFVVIRCTGISATDHETMPPFKGSKRT